MAEALEIEFSLRYPDGPRVFVSDLRVPTAPGQVTVFFGESGSGKTTVLRVLAGLARPDSGCVKFRKATWFDDRICLSPQQRNVGFVSQDYALFPHLSVAGNIAFGLGHLPKSERDARVQDALQWLGLQELGPRRPGEISGGQQQRVALARAVARRPQLLLLDEPLSALDSPTRLRLRAELHALLGRTGIPCIVVTHDPAETLALADEVVLMHKGSVLQKGPPSDVFNRPASIEAARILGVDTVVNGIVASQDGVLVHVDANGVSLTGVCEEPLTAGSTVTACVRAEDVMLAPSKTAAGSARNRLAASVVAVVDEAGLMRIELDCGFPLRAKLTRQSCGELDIRPGARIEAMIKAPNVHLIARDPAHNGMIPASVLHR